MNSGIYMWVAPSGGAYVGSSRNLKRRRYAHLLSLKKGNHHCVALQRSWDKYGDKILFVVLQNCPPEELIDREQWWLDNRAVVCKSLYNTSLTAAYASRSAEGQKRVSEANRKRVFTPEMRKRISLAQQKRFREQGVSDETRAKLSVPRGPHSVARREKLRYPKSQSHRDKLSEAQAASWTPERRASHAKRMIEQHARRGLKRHLEMLDWIAPPMSATG